MGLSHKLLVAFVAFFRHCCAFLALLSALDSGPCRGKLDSANPKVETLVSSVCLYLFLSPESSSSSLAEEEAHIKLGCRSCFVVLVGCTVAFCNNNACTSFLITILFPSSPSSSYFFVVFFFLLFLFLFYYYVDFALDLVPADQLWSERSMGGGKECMGLGICCCQD